MPHRDWPDDHTFLRKQSDITSSSSVVAEWTHIPWVARTAVGFKSVATSLLPTDVVGAVEFSEHTDAKVATISSINSYAHESIDTS